MKLKLILFSLLVLPAFASDAPQVHIFIPWGTDPGEIALVENPSGWQNLESFQVINDNTYLMTSNPGQMHHYEGQTHIKTEYLGMKQLKDFQIMSQGELAYLLTDEQVLSKRGVNVTSTWVNRLKQRPNSRLVRSSDSPPGILINLSETVILGEQPVLGILNRQQDVARMHMHTRNRMALLINEVSLLQVSSPRGEWGSGQYLNSDNLGNHYILMENILKQFPLQLRREILKVTPSGKISVRIQVPAFQHVSVSREFQIDSDGTIYGLITHAKGASIIKWSPVLIDQDPSQSIPLPQKFQNISPRPFTGDSLLPRPVEDEKNPGTDSVLRDFPPVGRDEAVETGATYVDLIWTASATNLTDGEISDPDGHPVETPTWVQVGQNQRMVYQWGGFSTITGFVNGLANGKYAGDMATEYPSAYAVGVDCSGFVCRTWNMPQHYSTWMMSNTQPLITQPMSSWNDVSPGDAIHKVGHVRLVVLRNTNGTILSVEAGGGWVTHYQTYSVSQLGDYQPRSYVYMEGMPATIEQPVLASTASDSIRTISWSLADTTGLEGVHIYQNDLFSNDNWSQVNEDVIPVDQTSYAMDVTDLSIGWKLRGVSRSTGAEGYASDTYAAADKSTPDKLLIVDGFDRTTGSYPFPYHDFALRMAESLGRFTLSYETTDNDAVLNGLVTLDDYTAVFWLLGDESTLHETFSNAEQDLVETYLISGGKLFVSGSEVGWDLDSQGSVADQSFFNNYLKADLRSDDSESYTINGEPGTAFAGLTLNYDDGNDGVYEENYPDAFFERGGSQAVLSYANNMIAATAYTGSFGAGTETGQVVILGIPFETIYSADQRLSLTTALLEYFELSTVLSTNEFQLPQELVMDTAFPNPFNSETNFRYDNPVRQAIQIRIFDLQGRQVRIIDEGIREPGQYRVSFSADGLSGGVYLAQLRTENFQQTQKIIYLK